MTKKEDLKKPATKGDLLLVKGDLEVVKGDLMLMKFDMDERFKEIEANMYTKEDHMKFMEWMDEAMTELRDGRDERRFSERHMIRMDDTLGDHEKRIVRLEKAA